MVIEVKTQLIDHDDIVPQSKERELKDEDYPFRVIGSGCSYRFLTRELAEACLRQREERNSPIKCEIYSMDDPLPSRKYHPVGYFDQQTNEWVYLEPTEGSEGVA